MWVSGPLEHRKNDLDLYCRELRAAILGVTTGLALEPLVDANLKSLPARPGLAAFVFVAPGLNNPIKLTYRQRGIEWLLHSVENHR